MIFLIHYNRATLSLVSIESFESRDLASTEKLKKEIELLTSSSGQEVVLLESESEESLRRTHRRYFETLNDIKSRETEAYSSAKPKFIKYWNVKPMQNGWLVQAEGVPEAIYPTKELATAAASKDSKDWSRSTGNTTAIRLWDAKGKFQEIVSTT